MPLLETVVIGVFCDEEKKETTKCVLSVCRVTIVVGVFCDEKKKKKMLT